MQTTKTFSLKIEQIALEKNISHMDAVLWYCSKNEIKGVLDRYFTSVSKRLDSKRLINFSVVYLIKENINLLKT